MAVFGESAGGPWALEKTLEGLLEQAKDQTKLLEALARKAGADTSGLSKSIGSFSNNLRRDQDTTEDNTRATRDLQKGMMGAVRAFGSSGNSMSRGLSNLSSDLHSFKMTGLGKFVGAAAIATEGLGIMWKRTTELADATFAAYDSGMVFSGGMHQLAKSASDVGLDLATFGKVLSHNSQVVAAIGIKRTNELGRSMLEATRGGVDLGMTFEQAQETLLSYTEQQRYSGNLNKMTTQELTQGAVAYGKELNTLSQLTGKRREQLDQEISEARKRPDMQILINSLSGPARAAAEKGMDTLLETFGPMGQQMQTMVAKFQARGFAGLSEQERMTLQLTGQMDNFAALANATMRGSSEDIMDISKNMGQQIQQRVSGDLQIYNQMPGVYGDAINAAQSMATALTTVSQHTETLGQGMPKDAADVKDAQQSLNKAANTTDLALSSLAAQTTEKAIPAIKAAADAANYAADGMMKFASYLHGDLMPTKKDILQMMTGVGAGAGIGLAGAAGALGVPGLQTLMELRKGKAAFGAVGEAGAVGAEGALAAGGEAALAGGLTKGFGRMALRGLKIGAGGVGGILGGMALDAATEHLRASGHEKLAAGTDIGSDALTGATTGAMIGSIIPGLGTAVGGAIGGALGGAYGLYQNWGNLFGGGQPAAGAEQGPGTDEIAQLTDAINQQTQQQQTMGGLPADVVQIFKDMKNDTGNTVARLLDLNGAAGAILQAIQQSSANDRTDLAQLHADNLALLEAIHEIDLEGSGGTTSSMVRSVGDAMATLRSNIASEASSLTDNAVSAMQSIVPNSLLDAFGLAPTASAPVLRGATQNMNELDGQTGAATAPATPTPPTQAPVPHLTPDQRHKQMIDGLTSIRMALDNIYGLEDRQLRSLQDGFGRMNGNIY